MNKATPLIKFTECFCIDPLFISSDKAIESYYLDKGIDIEAFKKIMYSFDMEEYTIILLYYFTEMYKRNKELYIDEFGLNPDPEDERQLEIDLTEALLFLYSDKSIDNTSITINKSRSSITIHNNTIVKYLANQIYIQYSNKGYNRINHTYDEAKELMLADPKWADKVYEDVNVGTADNPIIERKESEDEIQMFAHSAFKVVKLNKDVLKHRLKYLKSKYKKKRGAKVKNSGIANLIESLSFLKRIDRYLNQTETEYIYDIPLTNDDCRFIYACLVLFNIIEDNSKFRSKTLPENYIRTILKQKKMDSWIEEHIYSAKIDGIRGLKNIPEKSIN